MIFILFQSRSFGRVQYYNWKVMQPGIVGRPSGPYPHYIPPHHFSYQSNMSQRVPVYAHPLQHSYMQSLPHPYQPNLQVMPVQGYLPQYQPIYIQNPPFSQHIPQYYPHYMPSVSAVPVAPYKNNQSQSRISSNFDSQAAYLLNQTKMVQSSIFCVICGQQYSSSERQQHLQKHKRKPDSSRASVDVPSRAVLDYSIGTKKQYVVKPLVQPEQHIIPYEPLVYEVIQQVVYEDQDPSVRDEAIGEQPSFEQDPYISMEQVSSNRIPKKIVTQANPFVSKGSGHYQGGSMNEQVPFANFDPALLESIHQADMKMKQVEQKKHEGSFVQYEQVSVLHSSQAGNLSLNITEAKKDMIFSSV